MQPPLAGITVVALEQAVAAPFATRQLVDLGARVIKIERPLVGDFARHYDVTVHGEASYFVWLNRGKESVELDIKTFDGRWLLDALIAGADVFVHNLVPGSVERMGLDAATLRAARPALIHCSISGYGTAGPYQFKKAYDLLVQCETGMLMTTGTPEAPCKVGVSIADIATGMYAYSGILTALFSRERTGDGATIDVAMIDALGEWMSQPTYVSVYGDEAPRRTAARHASIAPYGPYLAADGGLVFLGVQSDREWTLLCDMVLHRPDLATDPRFMRNTDRVVNNDAITPLIEQAFGSSTSDEVAALLDRVGLANARLRTPAEFAEHPQILARDRRRAVPTPGGEMDALLPPVNIRGLEPIMGAVPSLGEHTDAVRAEFTRAPTQGERDSPADDRLPPPS